MYKVFINNKLLLLSSDGNYDIPLFSKKSKFILFNNDLQINKAIDYLYDTNKIVKVVIYSKNEKKLWNSFCKKFTSIETAGGMVFNSKNKMLMINRFEKWDLPKGKIEKNETARKAALREVCEETGVCNLKIISELPSTYHAYIKNKKHILKKTFWYKMKCKDFAGFKVQEKEGITDARWMNKREVNDSLKLSYPSIVDLIRSSRK